MKKLIGISLLFSFCLFANENLINSHPHEKIKAEINSSLKADEEKESSAQIAFDEATFFLKNNLQKKDVLEVVPEKLQFQIEKAGEGKKIEFYNTPLVRLKVLDIDEKVISSEKESILVLDDLSPEFKKAVLEMKEKEKRRFFLHPCLKFFKDSVHYPQKLLIFEIEILKNDKVDLLTPYLAEKSFR
jgi:FKBP-type peptidyl-prolyl cis-trans isomerase